MAPPRLLAISIDKRGDVGLYRGQGWQGKRDPSGSELRCFHHFIKLLADCAIPALHIGDPCFIASSCRRNCLACNSDNEKSGAALRYEVFSVNDYRS